MRIAISLFSFVKSSRYLGSDLYLEATSQRLLEVGTNLCDFEKSP